MRCVFTENLGKRMKQIGFEPASEQVRGAPKALCTR